MNLRLAGTIGTILVHSLLLLSLVRCAGGEEHPTKKPHEHTVSGSVKLLPPGTAMSLNPAKVEQDDGGKSCTKGTKHYFGMGIRVSPFTDLIIDAPPGLPAYDGGLRIGDLILDGLEPEAGWFNLIILRHTVRHAYHIKQQNICYR